MKLNSDWNFPIGVLAAWIIATAYTVVTLHAMDSDWRSYRATISASRGT